MHVSGYKLEFDKTVLYYVNSKVKAVPMSMSMYTQTQSSIHVYGLMSN